MAEPPWQDSRSRDDIRTKHHIKEKPMSFLHSIRSFATAGAFAVMAALPAAAATQLVTDEAGFPGGPQLDLTAFANGSYNFTFGPVALPNGITFTSNNGGGNSGQGSVVGQGGYGLASNGSFGGDATYIGVDSGFGYAELTFDTVVSSFGGFWNYAPGSGDNPVITALNALGEVIGSFDLSVLAPISTPGGFNEFAFRGITSDAADIKTIRFGGSYILLAGSANGTIPSTVPVPAAGWMLVMGLGALVANRRKKA
jgi:hypothetical protein